MLILSNLVNRVPKCKHKQRTRWDSPFKKMHKKRTFRRLAPRLHGPKYREAPPFWRFSFEKVLYSERFSIQNLIQITISLFLGRLNSEPISGTRSLLDSGGSLTEGELKLDKGTAVTENAEEWSSTRKLGATSLLLGNYMVHTEILDSFSSTLQGKI